MRSKRRYIERPESGEDGEVDTTALHLFGSRCEANFVRVIMAEAGANGGEC